MPPIIMIVFAIVYMISNVFPKGEKVRRIIDKLLPWMFLIFMMIGVSIRMGLPDDVEPDTNPAYNYLIGESAVTIIMLVISAILRSSRKKKMVQEVVQKKVITEEERRLKELPSSEAGRSNIVRKFSEKYMLKLTTLQIKSIVDGSFISDKWALEILAMDQKYAVPSEWYAGETDWLRAYLKAFNVQNVSADFDVQRDYCKSNFREALTAVPVNQYSDIGTYIEAINNTFMTNFDEVTFMVAYRFLLREGIRVDLPKAGIVRATNEVDELAKKYQ